MPSRRKIPLAVRHQVTLDAGERCSYCRSPALAGVPMVIDHIIPLVAGGTSNIENLCLACYRCNEFKNLKTSVRNPHSGQIILLFNPRTQLWSDHFGWSENGLLVVAHTPNGQATLDLLHLNSDWLVRARGIWILAGIHPPLE